ncbi:hypothetical protein YC2023_050487 [Brassica napus]
MANSRVFLSDLKSGKGSSIQRLHNECVENADRWVTGFLEIFEEGFIRRDEDEYKRHYARIKMLKKRKRKLLKTDAKDNKIILLMTWLLKSLKKGSEKGIVHDNDDVISRENHKEVNLYSYVTVGSSGDDLDAMAEPLPRVNKAGGRVSYMIKPRRHSQPDRHWQHIVRIKTTFVLDD